MTPAELEAESCKYSAIVTIVLPLSTGEYAVYNSRRQLVGITRSLEELMLWIATNQTYKMPALNRGPVKLSLADLDL
jgi:hypothetical protein